jgi:hypothetical protein
LSHACTRTRAHTHTHTRTHTHITRVRPLLAASATRLLPLFALSPHPSPSPPPLPPLASLRPLPTRPATIDALFLQAIFLLLLRTQPRSVGKAWEGRGCTGPYKGTVNLPQTKFNMRANSTQREPEIQRRWQENRVYETLVESNPGPVYTLHDGPPYANGCGLSRAWRGSLGYLGF